MDKTELLAWAAKIVTLEIRPSQAGSGRDPFLAELQRHQCPGCRRYFDHRLDGQQCNTCAVEQQ